MSSYTRQQLESWLKIIDIEENRVLDIGNSQQKICKRVKNFKADEYVGLDLERPHEGKQSDIICDLNRELEVDMFKWKEYFDVAFCIEVSEYCWNIYQALLNVNLFLKKEGILYISTHFLYPIHNPTEDDSIRLTPEGVNKLLKETGFETLEMKPRMLKNKNGYENFYMREGMRPAREYDKHDWAGCLIKAKKI